eukprot:jgi/Botrbrau1/13234/Bobra.0199s0007.1
MIIPMGTRGLSGPCGTQSRTGVLPVVCAAQPRHSRGVSKSSSIPHAFDVVTGISRHDAHQVDGRLAMSIPFPGNLEIEEPSLAEDSQDGELPHSEWLKRFLPFSALEDAAVRHLASAIRSRPVFPGDVLMTSGEQIKELVIIEQGHAEVVQQKLSDPVRHPTHVGPGAVFGWRALLRATPALITGAGSMAIEGGARASETVVVREGGTVWTIPAAEFARIAGCHPDMAWSLTEELALELAAAEAAIEEDEIRLTALQPYSIGNQNFPIIGSSKYAVRLRKEVEKAAASPTRDPLLIFGEMGLAKTDVAALIHYSSADRNQVVARVDCSCLDPQGSLIFGTPDTKGLLHWIGRGTLILKDIDLAPSELVPRLQMLVSCHEYVAGPVSGARFQTERMHTVEARIMLLARRRNPIVEALEPLCTSITVPPLRVRLSDVESLADFFLKEAGRYCGQPPKTLSRQAVVRLKSYKYPNNIAQLRAIVDRAASQTDGDIIPESVLWFAAQDRDRFRINLLDSFPPLRQALRSPMWTQGFNFKYTAPAFAAYLAILFFFPQDRGHNFALNLFWDWWWPGIFLAYPVLGRFWCSVCPFMIYGELVQKWRVASGAVLQKWPRQKMEEWGPWFLYGLFFSILIWEEVWDLDDTAYLSGWLLILITAGAVITSAFFERRMWCRYLCPIGGMNGLFAKASVIEVRGREGVCAASCNTYSCLKGGAGVGEEGMDTFGCPLHSHPAQLHDNRNCVMCMECVKACSNRSVEVRLRPPGVDLWSGHKQSASELALMFMLLGAVYVHRLPELMEQAGLDDALLDGKPLHMLITAGLLAVPGLLAWGTDAVGRLFPVQKADRPQPFLTIAYGYLPLVWAATLAHYLENGMIEAGQVLRVGAATFGYEHMHLPALAAPHDIVTFFQGSTLLLGAGLSLALTRKLAESPWSTLLPQTAAILAFTAELWFLIV